MRNEIERPELRDVNAKGGGLPLDSKAGWMRGGDGGPAVVPGEPKKSLLVEAIQYAGLEMPPPDKGGRLPPAEVAAFVRRVESGAFDPREEAAKIGGMSLAQAKTWWSFGPPTAASEPLTSGRTDALLDADLARRGETANAPADKGTLLRPTAPSPTPGGAASGFSTPSDATFPTTSSCGCRSPATCFAQATPPSGGGKGSSRRVGWRSRGVRGTTSARMRTSCTKTSSITRARTFWGSRSAAPAATTTSTTPSPPRTATPCMAFSAAPSSPSPAASPRGGPATSSRFPLPKKPQRCSAPGRGRPPPTKPRKPAARRSPPYGLARGQVKGFAWQRLAARRLVELGLRFVELLDTGSSDNGDATILKLMGFDHEKPTYRRAGRDYRLTDVEGKVVDGIPT